MPLACSAIISFWGRQAKSCGLEGSFEHPGVHYQHDTHTFGALHVAVALSCLQFVLALRNW